MFRRFINLFFFYNNYWKYRSFLIKNAKEISSYSYEKTESYIVVLEPWKYTACCWFSVTLGILLLKKKAKVKFLINDLPFEKGIDHTAQIFGIKSIVKYLPSCLTYEFLSKSKKEQVFGGKSNEVVKELNQLAFANAIHKSRGEHDSENFRKEVNSYLHKYQKNYSIIRDYVEEQKESFFIFPGGVYGYTGLFSYAIMKSGSKFYTYDSGIGVLLTCFNGVAAQNKDIPYTLQLILDENDSGEIECAKKLANEESEKRINGTDPFKTQYSSMDESIHLDDVGFLIPLNSPWDSAMLKIDYLFNSYREWVIETVGLILDNTTENVTIRQHPDERTELGKGSLDFGQILKEKYSNNPRIQYFSCIDKVNTYSLLPNSKAVICFASTFGIEAALSGKKVIVCSEVYYSDLNFVIKPTNKTEFVKILKDIDHIPLPSEDEINIAALTFYLGQKCNWIFTTFTPSNVDFSIWSKLAITEIERFPEVSLILKSIGEQTPISYLLHKELCRQ